MNVLCAAKTRERIEELTAHAKGKARQQDFAFRELFFDLEFSALPVQADLVIRTDNIGGIQVDTKVYSAICIGVPRDQADQRRNGHRSSHHRSPTRALKSGRSIARLNPT